MKGFGSGIAIGIAALAVALASPPALAQEKDRLPRIGFLANTVPLNDLVTRRSSVPLYAGHPTRGVFDFEEELRKLGWVDGKNVRILWRSAENRFERLPTLADELIAARPDVLVAFGTGVGHAFEKTRSIPIVMGSFSGSPVAAGFTKNLSRPTANVTGVLIQPDGGLLGKRLTLLKAAAPKTTRVAVMVEVDTAAEKAGLRIGPQSRATAERLGVSLLIFGFTNAGEFEGVFELALKEGADAALLTESALLFWQAAQAEIQRLAVRHRMPVMQSVLAAPELGGLMAYAADISENYRRAAYFVDRILRGAKPRDLPIEQPARFEFVINAKAAEAIGLAIPGEALLQADRVIR